MSGCLDDGLKWSTVWKSGLERLHAAADLASVSTSSWIGRSTWPYTCRSSTWPNLVEMSAMYCWIQPVSIWWAGVDIFHVPLSALMVKRLSV